MYIGYLLQWQQLLCAISIASNRSTVTCMPVDTGEQLIASMLYLDSAVCQPDNHPRQSIIHLSNGMTEGSLSASSQSITRNTDSNHKHAFSVVGPRFGTTSLCRSAHSLEPILRFPLSTKNYLIQFFEQFWPSSPVTLCHTSWNPLRNVTFWNYKILMIFHFQYAFLNFIRILISRLRFTFRCDLARVINLICICGGGG